VETNATLSPSNQHEQNIPTARQSALPNLVKRLGSYRGGMLIIVLLFLIMLPISNPRIYAVDEVGYYVYLRSLYFDGDLDFENEYRTLDALNPNAGIAAALLKPGPIKDGGRRNEVTGLYGNVAPVGSALLWSPFYIVADIGVQIANALGVEIVRDGYSKPYILAVSYASAIYGLLGLLICHQLALRFVKPFAATLATISIWLASSLVFYMIVQMPWSHATGFFAVSCFVAFWYRTREQRRLRDWALLGLLAGLMTIVREQLLLFVAIPAIEALWQVFHHSKASALPAHIWEGVRSLPFVGYIVAGLAALLMLSPQLATYQILNGAMRPNTEVSGKFRDTWYSPCFFHTLVDPTPCLNSPGGNFSHGALLWSPVLILALAGLALLWKRDRMLTLAFIAAFAAQMFVNGSIYTWHQSGAFGFRRFIECSPIFIIGLAMLIQRFQERAEAKQRFKRQIASVVVAAALIAWNIGLIFNWTVGHTELRRGLDWNHLIAWQLEVPLQASEKLSTLLFDRCKLYQNQGCN